jgi:hypothetical protein
MMHEMPQLPKLRHIRAAHPSPDAMAMSSVRITILERLFQGARMNLTIAELDILADEKRAHAKQLLRSIVGNVHSGDIDDLVDCIIAAAMLSIAASWKAGQLP